ncbi:MAG: hypothetical protein LBU24_05940 [Methanocalculaceae archaeon]|nr:hypothetical protein [Methanocalculaceae archaeon]
MHIDRLRCRQVFIVYLNSTKMTASHGMRDSGWNRYGIWYTKSQSHEYAAGPVRGRGHQALGERQSS